MWNHLVAGFVGGCSGQRALSPCGAESKSMHHAVFECPMVPPLPPEYAFQAMLPGVASSGLLYLYMTDKSWMFAPLLSACILHELDRLEASRLV